MSISSKNTKAGEASIASGSLNTFNPGGMHEIAPEGHGGLHRTLDNRQIQLNAIAGPIGTSLFILIGYGLAKGGPASLLIAYTFCSIVLANINNSLAEITVAYPVAGGFVRFAGHFVDDAWGFTASWNFFFYQGFLIPVEITFVINVISFWAPHVTDPSPTAAVCAGTIALYVILNLLPVAVSGEAQFWLCGAKVVLFFMLYVFVLVTMLGCNPSGDVYGFRYWRSPFATHLSKGSLGKLEGFLAAVWNASFAVVGPEFISIVAAEAKRPRRGIKAAFKMAYIRFGVFFIGSALAVGTVLPYDDPTLQAFANVEDGDVVPLSPYVIAAQNLGIDVLPQIISLLLASCLVSAGNNYTYSAIRTLHTLAAEGRAPKALRYTTRKGVPVYCLCAVMLFPLLSFLQVTSGSAKVLSWLVSMIIAGGVINYIIICVTYIKFHRACAAQKFDRRQLPYHAYFQPYSAWIGLIWMTTVALFFGYESFRPWKVATFFQRYTVVLVSPALFVGWKFYKRTHWRKPHEVDLVWERPGIDAYEAELEVREPAVSFWREMGRLVGWGGKVRKGGEVDAEANRGVDRGANPGADGGANVKAQGKVRGKGKERSQGSQSSQGSQRDQESLESWEMVNMTQRAFRAG